MIAPRDHGDMSVSVLAPVESTSLPVLLKNSDLTAIFGCDVRTIRRWIARGHLDPVRIGRSTFFRQDDIRRLVASKVTDRALGKSSRK